jgi:hypothetical protein
MAALTLSPLTDPTVQISTQRVPPSTPRTVPGTCGSKEATKDGDGGVRYISPTLACFHEFDD